MYDNKYLKYKNKYLALKMHSLTQVGGAHPWGDGGGGGGGYPGGGGGGGGGAGYPGRGLPFFPPRHVLPPPLPPPPHPRFVPLGSMPDTTHNLTPNPEHSARPFLLNERVIVDRRRIAKIVSICQNSPDIGGKISYNVHYVDTNPRELQINISEDRLIRLPRNIHTDQYKILQRGQSVMVNNGTEELALITQIRDNVRECYSVRYISRAMAYDAKTGKTLGNNTDECVDISNIRPID